MEIVQQSPIMTWRLETPKCLVKLGLYPSQREKIKRGPGGAAKGSGGNRREQCCSY